MVGRLIELEQPGDTDLNPLLQMTSRGDAASPYQAGDELVRALAPAGRQQRVERGGRLFSFGDEATGVYLIVKGTARASLAGKAGRELICRMAGPGSVLGLPAALCAKSYPFDVEALEAVEAIYLETATVNEILRQQPELCMQVMNMMCDELSGLRQTHDHMRNCAKESCSLHESCVHVDTLQ
jgi:CRP-like cAMP-binding protein